MMKQNFYAFKKVVKLRRKKIKQLYLKKYLKIMKINRVFGIAN